MTNVVRRKANAATRHPRTVNAGYVTFTADDDRDRICADDGPTTSDW